MLSTSVFLFLSLRLIDAGKFIVISNDAGSLKHNYYYPYYNEQEYQDSGNGEDDDYGEDVDLSPDESLLIHQPSIISNPLLLEVDNGMTIQLPCIVDHLPDGISIVWSKEGEKYTIIAMGSKIFDQEYKDRATVMVDDKGSTLTIVKAKSEDAGQYKCSVAVKNNPSEIIHTVRMRGMTLACSPIGWYAKGTSEYRVVESSPLVQVANSFLHKSIGDIAEIVCQVSAVPMPRIVWSKDGQELISGPRVKISNFGSTHTLTIIQLQQGDFGKYICQASNSFGSEKRMIEIKGHAEFKSENEEFLLEISHSPYSSWESFTVIPTKDGAYDLSDGQKFLSYIQPATHYRIRITAKNRVPLRVTASTTSPSSSILVLLLCMGMGMLRMLF